MPTNPLAALLTGDASGPATGSDAVDLSSTDRTYTGPFPYALYCEGAGNVKFDGVDGTTDTWAVPANFVIPVAVAKVYKTGTTATGLHALFKRT
jgi:hypothetical protein